MCEISYRLLVLFYVVSNVFIFLSFLNSPLQTIPQPPFPHSLPSFCAPVHVCMYACVCAGVGVVSEESSFIIIWLFSLMFYCIHFCCSCTEWCVHHCWWNTVLEKWQLLLLLLFASQTYKKKKCFKGTIKGMSRQEIFMFITMLMFLTITQSLIFLTGEKTVKAKQKRFSVLKAKHCCGFEHQS